MAFVGASDMAASREFYEGRLGLRLTSSSPFGDTYDADGTELRVAAVGDLQPAHFTVLGWAVEDMDAALGALAEAGVELADFDGVPQDDRRVWLAPDGTQVAWFHDPSGNVLSLHQLA